MKSKNSKNTVTILKKYFTDILQNVMPVIVGTVHEFQLRLVNSVVEIYRMGQKSRATDS